MGAGAQRGERGEAGGATALLQDVLRRADAGVLPGPPGLRRAAAAAEATRRVRAAALPVAPAPRGRGRVDGRLPVAATPALAPVLARAPAAAAAVRRRHNFCGRRPWTRGLLGLQLVPAYHSALVDGVVQQPRQYLHTVQQPVLRIIFRHVVTCVYFIDYW